MYHFRKEKLKELLGDNTIIWLSKELDYTPQMLYNIFNDNIGCRKIIAQAIVKTMDHNFNIEDFFDYIERK